MYPGLQAVSAETLPTNFSWGKISSTDTAEEKSKKKNISTPGNQLLCGSCWAFSSSRVVSDNFVVSGITKDNPDLSATFCLACYPQGKCDGGNPAELLKAIEKGGIKSNKCLDYDWCSDNGECNGSGISGGGDLSYLIPDCKCKDPTKKYPTYKVKNPQVLSINTNPDVADITRKHIYHKGPVIGGFFVLKNFTSGNHTKMNGGVYLENGIYDNPNKVTFDENPDYSQQLDGGHAVSIMGWGVAENILVDNKGTRKNVPYWHVRNSWGEKWGDKGYFKLAMYPYNKIACFDKIVNMTTPSGNIQCGGIVAFDTVNSHTDDENQCNNNIIHTTCTPCIPCNTSDASSILNKNTIIIIIMIIVIILLFIFMIS